MIYLNDACETVIYIQDDGLTLPDGAEIRVKPETDKALVFFHYLLHEGAPVTSGRKYVLHTDVMYRVDRDE